MLYTLQLTKQSSKRWEATRDLSIILWLLVCLRRLSTSAITYLSLATSGACATIASDALMNPFDGGLQTWGTAASRRLMRTSG